MKKQEDKIWQNQLFDKNDKTIEINLNKNGLDVTYKAKKKQAGQYIYREHEVHVMEDRHWNIRHVGDEFWCDGANTLSGAKSIIDRWLGNIK